MSLVKKIIFFSALKVHFDRKLNLARIKYISLFVITLTKVRTISFESLARAFKTFAKESTSLGRIQRFILSYYLLDSDLIAKLIFGLLPFKKQLTLSFIKTNWKFCKTNINIFMLAIVYQGVAFSLLLSMLKKRGISNLQEKINLIERYINLYGKESIDCVVTDREFIGKIWLKYLNDHNLRYYIHIRINFKAFIPRKNETFKVFWLLINLYKINEQLCYLSVSKLYKGEYLILVSFTKLGKAGYNYKQRWQIETSFKALKSRDFDIEKTHPADYGFYSITLQRRLFIYIKTSNRLKFKNTAKNQNLFLKLNIKFVIFLN